MVRAVGCPKTSQFLLFKVVILSTESLTMPSYLNLCSGSRVLIFIMDPSLRPTTNSDSFFPSIRVIDLGKLGRVILWKVYK